MFHFIYRTTNTHNGKQYIGRHSTKRIHDGYLGSGSLLKVAITKHGKSAFKFEILEFFDSHETVEAAEARYVTEEYCRRDDTYNLIPGGRTGAPSGDLNHFYGKTHSEETRRKISETNKGSDYSHMRDYAPLSEDHKAKLRLGAKKRTQIDVNGVRYDSLRQMERALGVERPRGRNDHKVIERLKKKGLILTFLE